MGPLGNWVPLIVHVCAIAGCNKEMLYRKSDIWKEENTTGGKKYESK